MRNRVSTIIIEPRLVLREALELLVANYSYRVLCGFSSIEEITRSSDRPELVILGAQSAEKAAKGAEDIRALWPDCKIVFLVDDSSSADLQHIILSQLDGCIPLFVSPDDLMSTLDQILVKNVRVMVMGDRQRPSPQIESLGTDNKVAKLHQTGNGHSALAVTVFEVRPLAPSAIEICDLDPCTEQAHGVETKPPTLSEREIRILDGLVKGHTNKVIARGCGITEATVKVHMKSILRKIRVGNRTQAAIWALEHGYSAEAPKALVG